MLQLSLSHSQKRGAFCSSADVTIAYRYWVKHPVLLDSRPADCVTTSASNTGCFVMTAKDGKPCRKCGCNEWYDDGRCAPCRRNTQGQWRDSNLEHVKAKKREWREKNPDKVRAMNQKQYYKDPEMMRQRARNYHWENKGKENSRSRKYYQQNRESLNQKAKQWAEKNPERKRESFKKWCKNNHDKLNANSSRRRTRIAEGGGSYTDKEWRALVKHYGGKCLCCGRSDVALTVDHIIPVVKGGSSNIDNIQPLCQSCNSSKGTQTIDYRPDTGLGRWIQRKLFR